MTHQSPFQPKAKPNGFYSRFKKGNKLGFKKGNKLWKKRSQWVGEGGVDSLGYHRTTKNYVRRRTHRIVAEEMLGRKLKKNEIVHHKNHVRTDNRPENLRVMTRSEHAILHYRLIKKDKKGRLIANKLQHE